MVARGRSSLKLGASVYASSRGLHTVQRREYEQVDGEKDWTRLTGVPIEKVKMFQAGQISNRFTPVNLSTLSSWSFRPCFVRKFTSVALRGAS
jgi:hypothetical protein